MPDGTILVVEDDEITSGMLRFILEREGFEVSVAEDGEEGLRLLAEGGMHLMLTDCLLPKLDGFKLVERARSMDGLQEIPIIMMSAIYRKGNYYQAAREAGADLYIVKPFKPEELLDSIARLLEGRGEDAGGRQ